MVFIRRKAFLEDGREESHTFVSTTKSEGVVLRAPSFYLLPLIKSFIIEKFTTSQLRIEEEEKSGMRELFYF